MPTNLAFDSSFTFAEKINILFRHSTNNKCFSNTLINLVMTLKNKLENSVNVYLVTTLVCFIHVQYMYEYIKFLNFSILSLLLKIWYFFAMS